MLGELSSEQLTYWMAFNFLEPFGPRASWIQSGQIASMIGNTHLRKGARPFSPQDFMPALPKKAQKRQTLAEMKSVLLALAEPAEKTKMKRKRTKGRATLDG
jgi:hypothetical protein